VVEQLLADRRFRRQIKEQEALRRRTSVMATTSNAMRQYLDDTDKSIDLHAPPQSGRLGVSGESPLSGTFSVSAHGVLCQRLIDVPERPDELPVGVASLPRCEEAEEAWPIMAIHTRSG
jgi:hypothetical protein